jgi:hypothetical protein
MRTRRGIVVGLLVTALALGLAPSAHADVLVNAPKARVCVNHGAIRTGVWYQTATGGPRWFHIRIYRKATGALVFSRNGKATTTWKYFRYVPKRVGLFRIRYVVPGSTPAFLVRSVRCS